MRNEPGGMSRCAVLALSLPVALWPLASYAAAPALAVQASGVFINMRGDVLTARHAVSDCPSLFVVKNGQVAPATVLAISNEANVAVLRTSLKPLLWATFSELPAPADHSIEVFSEAYAELQRLPDRARLLGNALTVLDGCGLLLGIVEERVAAGSGGGVELSAAHHAGRRHQAFLAAGGGAPRGKPPGANRHAAIAGIARLDPGRRDRVRLNLMESKLSGWLPR